MSPSEPSTVLVVSLAPADAARLSACLLELHALPLDQHFLEGLLRVVRRLAPGDHGVYGLSDLAAGMLLVAHAYPRPIEPPGWVAGFEHHLSEHPLQAAADRVAPGSVVSTDQLGGPAWRRSTLRNELCRPLGLDEQLLLRLPSAVGTVEAVGVARSDAPFDPVEHQLLQESRDHLLLAWSKVLHLGLAGTTARSTATTFCTEVVQADADGRIRLAGASALARLGRFFPHHAEDRLPDPVTRWIRDELARPPGREARRFERQLTVEHGGSTLEIWLATGPRRPLHDLYLRERPAWVAPPPPAPLPAPARSCEPQLARAASRWKLTRRQRDVLGLLVSGGTNKDLARQLGCAEVTIEFHLTAVFRKAAVPGRAALIARYFGER